MKWVESIAGIVCTRFASVANDAYIVVFTYRARHISIKIAGFFVAVDCL